MLRLLFTYLLVSLTALLAAQVDLVGEDMGLPDDLLTNNTASEASSVGVFVSLYDQALAMTRLQARGVGNASSAEGQFLTALSNYTTQNVANCEALVNLYNPGLQFEPIDRDFIADAQSASPLLGGFAINESEIIQGITQWAFDRAQQELLKAFLQEWIEAIEEEPIMAELLPSTLNLLSTTEFTTILTQGDMWKEAFLRDIKSMPERTPGVVEEGLNLIPESQISAALKKEINATALLGSEIYLGALESKPMDELVLNLGAQRFLTHYPELGKSEAPYADKSLILAAVFLDALQTYNTDKSPFQESFSEFSYLDLSQILHLSEEEFRNYWTLLILRNAKQLQLLTNQTGYELIDKLLHYDDMYTARRYILQWVDLTSSFKNQIKSSNREFSIVNISEYLEIALEWMDSGTDFIEDFSIAVDTHIIHTYKETARPIAQNISYMAEGIAMDDYGKVVNGLLDIITLILEKQDHTFDFDDLAGKLKFNSIDELLTSIKEVTSLELSPAQRQSVLAKYQAFNSKNEKKLELAILEILNGTRYQEIAEAINTYGQFMVNVLTAENSEEVKSAFENAALSVGSYKIKTSSNFSVTLSFMPGFETGFEQVEPGAGFQSRQYVGVTLPVGIDLAFGSRSKCIGAYSIYLQALDLGAVLNYSLSDTNGVEQEPEFGFRQVLSPGAHFLVHLSNAPIVFGVGASYSPLLRNVQNGVQETQASVVQFGLTVAVDVTAFQFYASKHKTGAQIRARDAQIRY